MAHIFGLSDGNRPTAKWPLSKPNEDSYAFWIEGDFFAAAVMDGIPVLRDEKGEYPETNGKIASEVASRTICNMLRSVHPDSDSGKKMISAFDSANNAIRAENNARGLYDQNHPMWLGTVGCALWGHTGKNTVLFCFIGDPIGFVLKKSGEFHFLAEDQLLNSHEHIHLHHREEDELRVRIWQDEYVRNRSDAKCWCGVGLEGWGALNGQPSAMEFVRVSELDVSTGDRIILASDGICVLSPTRNESRRLDDYRVALESVRNLNPENAAKELLRITREHEKDKSDDATFLVIDF